MIIREYKESGCTETVKLFYDTVHTVNIKDYTKEQVNVWATKKIDLAKFNQSLLNNYSLVAIKDNSIVGFGDIDQTGYLDKLFVHKDYQKEGIATAICNQLEQNSLKKEITVHSSITAKSFFEKRGYTIIKRQEVKKQNIYLVNYVMKKYK